MPQSSPTRKVAMVSYNRFANGDNGWNHGIADVLLLQDTNLWGAPQFGLAEGLPEARAEGIASVGEKVGSHWQTLAESLLDLDTVYIYVGDRGSEGAIELAQANGLSPSKAVFVFCSCNLHKKRALVAYHGFKESQIINCECGGHATMGGIYRSLMVQGCAV